MDLEALNDKAVRIEAFRYNFPLFFAYHYGRQFTKFQVEWMNSLQGDLSVIIKAFRASRKTTIVRGRLVRLIVYKKEPSIIWQSYEDDLSGASVRETAKMLCKRSIVNDYGMLFPFEAKKEEFAKKSLSNFTALNGVKIASKSLGQTLRGENTYDIHEEMSSRPTVLVLDDIDVTKSVNNIDIINANEQKILAETIGALDPLRRKIVLLGNVINEDGVVPRFRNRYSPSAKWACFEQPLFVDGVNVWPEVFTEQVVEVLMEDGKTSWNQNYLLIPSVAGNGVFTRQYFDYFLLSHFEQVDGILKKNDLKCSINIDPAFSTNYKSDDAVVVGVGEHNVSKKVYVLKGYAATSAQSKTIQAAIVIYNNMVADGFPPQYFSIENAVINKQQTQFIKDFKDELVKHQINIPVYLYESKVKKEIRIQDNLEGIMSQKGILFSRNLDKDFLSKMENQFLEFPNGDHDDIPDTISQALEVFRKKPGVKKTEREQQPKTFTDPATGERKTRKSIRLPDGRILYM